MKLAMISLLIPLCLMFGCNGRARPAYAAPATPVAVTQSKPEFGVACGELPVCDTCRVHGKIRVRGRVPIRHGLLRVTTEYEEAEKKLFPSSWFFIWGSCELGGPETG